MSGDGRRGFKPSHTQYVFSLRPLVSCTLIMTRGCFLLHQALTARLSRATPASKAKTKSYSQHGHETTRHCTSDLKPSP